VGAQTKNFKAQIAQPKFLIGKTQAQIMQKKVGKTQAQIVQKKIKLIKPKLRNYL